VTIDWDQVLPEPVPAPRRLITRRRVLVAALFAAAAIIAGGVVWLLTDDPLAQGSVGGAPGGTARWTSVDTGAGDIVYYVSAAEPAAFEIGYDLANEGRLPVTIQGIGSPSAFTLAGMARYPTLEEPDRQVAGAIVPFEPVTIDPGDARFLVLQIRIAGESVCATGGGRGLPSDPTFRYRTLGVVPRTATVELPFTVVTVCGDELPPSYSWRDGAR